VTTAENFERGLPLGMIYATSRAMLRDRVRSLRDANVYEAQRYRHIIASPLVTPDEGRGARAQTGFLVARIMHTGETTLIATGRYENHIMFDDGAARFAQKVLITRQPADRYAARHSAVVPRCRSHPAHVACASAHEPLAEAQEPCPPPPTPRPSRVTARSCASGARGRSPTAPS
jgi:hypothetical protein